MRQASLNHHDGTITLDQVQTLPLRVLQRIVRQCEIEVDDRRNRDDLERGILENFSTIKELEPYLSKYECELLYNKLLDDRSKSEANREHFDVSEDIHAGRRLPSHGDRPSDERADVTSSSIPPLSAHYPSSIEGSRSDRGPGSLSAMPVSVEAHATARKMAAIAGTAAVAAVGASVGRDIYKAAKREHIVIKLVAIMVVSSGWIGYDLAKGVDGSWTYRFFRLYVFNALLFLVVVFSNIFVFGNQVPNVIHLVQLVVFLGGAAFGSSARAKRNLANSIIDHNARFLQTAGIVDVGGRDRTFIDRDGNELKLLDVRRDAIIFKIQARRGLQARIMLDIDGRMIAYALTD